LLLNSQGTIRLLKKDADPKAVEQRLKSIDDERAAPQIEKLLNEQYNNSKANANAFELKLQPLTSIYLYSKEKYGVDPNAEWGSSRIGNILFTIDV